MQPISIAFVDDHPILLSGISRIFSERSEFRVVGTGTDAAAALQLVAEHRPDVIVLDLSMPGRVVEAIAQIATSGGPTQALVFTAATGIDAAIGALDAGAKGYVLKGSTVNELIEAVQAVHAGETFITPSFAAKVVAGIRQQTQRRTEEMAVRLSVREDQIVRHLLKGRTNKEIANALNISDKTVKHHMTALIQKLQVRNRTEVVLAAQQLELAKPQPGLSAHL
jgi:two-component system, NarL family, nitrate/nitrite response regulator NarL